MRPDLSRSPRGALALAAGLAAALAHPPFGFLPGLAGYDPTAHTPRCK